MSDYFVNMIVDCSGSMAGWADFVSRNIREYMKMLEQLPDEYHVRVVEIGTGVMGFDVIQGTSKDFRTYQLEANGGTPLYDGIGRAFNGVNDPAGMGVPCLTILISDGGEGGSWSFNWQEIVEMIRDKVETGWKFSYLMLGSDSEVTWQAEEIKKAVNKRDRILLHRWINSGDVGSAFFDKSHQLLMKG